MEQLLIHLVSDYWLQNDWMASNKKKNFLVALIHAIVYTIPFILLTKSILALLVICITHAIIDGTNLVGYLNAIKNFDFYEHHTHEGVFKDGYGSRPAFIRVWLVIIQDNILHLLINYVSILYL